jgi:carbon-monoxide dehydrogenase medium subunit
MIGDYQSVRSRGGVTSSAVLKFAEITPCCTMRSGMWRTIKFATAEPLAAVSRIAILPLNVLQSSWLAKVKLLFRDRAEDFFQGLLSTDLEHDEVITSIQLPPWSPTRFWAFSEFSRRAGDFALAGVAMHFEMVGDCISAPSIVGFGVGDRALVLRATQNALESNPPEPETIARAVSIAREEIDPPPDPHAPPDYRRELFGVLLERALKEALGRNRGLTS